MNTLIKTLVNGSKIINSVKEQTLYATLKVVDRMVKREVEMNPEMTYEQKCKLESTLRDEVTFNLIKSVANYLVDSDSIEVLNTSVDQAGIEISAKVERSGEVFSFVTEMIFAGGYNIQALHVRYIVKTELKKIGTGTKAIEQKVSKIERLKNELKYYRNAFARYESEMIEAQISSDLHSEKRMLNEMKSVQKNIDKYISKIKEELSK